MTKQKAAAAGFWSAVDIVLRQGVQLVVTVVLARLLTPEDFGIIALMIFFTTFSIAFAQSGLTMGLIQRQDTSRDEESAVFWWNLAIALTFSAGLAACGPALAAFYGHDVLGPLMWIAAAQVILSALGAVHSALLTRDLRFDQLTKVGIASSVLSGAVGIGVAVAGGGIWALAAQIVAASAANLAGMWWVNPWRPSRHWRFRTGSRVFSFGTWVSVGSLLEVLYTHGSALLIGKFYGVRDLGFYGRAANTQLMPSTSLAQIVSRIALPLFAARASEPEALKRGLKMAIGLAMMVNLPIMAALALLSTEVILVLFGEKWLPAAPILSILAISGIFLPLHAINLQMLLAQGNTPVFLRNEIVKKTIGVACVLVGSLFGIVGLACSQVVYSFLAVIVNTRPSHDSLGYGLTEQLRDLFGIFLATLTMAGAVVLLKSVLDTDPSLTLAVCSVAAGLTYVLAGLLLRSRPFLDARTLFPFLLSRREI